MKGTKRQERFKKAEGYRQEANKDKKGHPFKVTSCGRRRPQMYKDSYGKK